MSDNPRRFAETLGSGEEVHAHWGGRASDVHEKCRKEIERLRLAYEKAVLLRQLEHTHFCSNDIHGKCLHWAEDQLEQASRND